MAYETSALARAMRQMEPDEGVREWFDDQSLLDQYIQAFYTGPQTFALWYQTARFLTEGELPFPHEVFPRLKEIGDEIGFYEEVFDQTSEKERKRKDITKEKSSNDNARDEDNGN